MTGQQLDPSDCRQRPFSAVYTVTRLSVRRWIQPVDGNPWWRGRMLEVAGQSRLQRPRLEYDAHTREVPMPKDSKKMTPTITTRRDGSQSISWGPARGSRPPFRQGNTAAVKHGAYSERMIAEVAITVGEELLYLFEDSAPEG